MVPNLVNFQFYRRFELRIYGNDRFSVYYPPRRGERDVFQRRALITTLTLLFFRPRGRRYTALGNVHRYAM